MDSRPRSVAGVPAAPAGSLPDPDAGSRRIVRLCFAAALLAIAIFVARSYVVALAWAAVIAVAAWPLYRRFAPRVPGRSRTLAALLFTILAALVLALVEIGREAQAILQWAGEAQRDGVPVPEWLTRVPLLGQHVEQIGSQRREAAFAQISQQRREIDAVRAGVIEELVDRPTVNDLPEVHFVAQFAIIGA